MTIKIASRSSKLALAQVEEFVKKFGISDYKIIKVKTEGDIKSANGETLFDKAHFVSDVQKCLLNSEADIAVHSAKDTPAGETTGLLRYFLPSQSNEDVLIFREEDKFNSEMKLGTRSLRRQLQAKHHLNAINIVNLSGNVDTRLEKLSQGEYDCIILAKAGLARLKLLNELIIRTNIIIPIIEPEIFFVKVKPSVYHYGSGPYGSGSGVSGSYPSYLILYYIHVSTTPGYDYVNLLYKKWR